MAAVFLVFGGKSGNMRLLGVTLCCVYKVRWEIVRNDAANGVRESPGFNFGFIL